MPVTPVNAPDKTRPRMRPIMAVRKDKHIVITADKKEFDKSVGVWYEYHQLNILV